MKQNFEKGFTLVELMISMLLGLIIVGGVVSVMLANSRSYKTNEGLGQVQESARTAFELIARDLRQSGGNGCDNNNRTANNLDAGTIWWQNWFGLQGIESAQTDTAVANGSGLRQRVDGTDSLHMQGIESALPVNVHNAATNSISVNALTTPYGAGDIMLVCDFDHAALFRASTYDSGTRTVTYATGGAAPGNCSTGLGFPIICGAGNIYAFPTNAQIARLAASAWYVGNNDRPEEGGRSLYRIRLDSAGVETTEEMVAGVTDMQLRYALVDGNDIIEADDAAMDWTRVSSVFVSLTVDSADTNVTTNPGENSGRIQRTFNYQITLRNRVP